jgi:hypothetical protein
LLGACAAAAMHAAPPITVRFLSYDDVHGLPGIDRLDALAAVPESGRPAAWDAFVRARDADVHERLLRGEEDSLAYLLVFGTSYTTAPRVTRDFLEQTAGTGPSATPSAALQHAFDQRLTDCLQALAAPGLDERLSWAAATMARLGFRLDTAEGSAKAAEYMLRNLSRVLRESTDSSQVLQAAGAAGGATELAQRARIFSRRGLAPDTSWPIGFAVAEALEQLRHESILHTGGVRRVAIIGPGLDFVDKDEGHDYYAPQSLQPFAVVDALLTSGLAGGSEIDVTTIDINPHVNSHLSRLTALSGQKPFDLQLVRDRRVAWTTAASHYWDTFGSRIGTEVRPIAPPPSLASLEGRAIRLSAGVLRRLHPIEANIVYQRIEPEADEQFDLVIATNILLYYDSFEQMLAAQNIVRLLGAGGLFLTNTRLDDVEALSMRRVAATASAFSSRPGDGEYIYAYEKKR